MLEGRDEVAVRLAAQMAAGAWEDLVTVAVNAVAAGVLPSDIREVVYVSSLYCGLPRGVAALLAIDGVIEAGAHRRPAPEERAVTRERGEGVFRRIHRHNADRQLAMLERLHPDFADTVLVEAYGAVIARDALPLATRELVAVASLTAQGLVLQLRAHAMGALNAGATHEVVAAAIGLAAGVAGVAAGPALAELAGIMRRRRRPAGGR